MNCPRCGFDNPSDSKFCKECGTGLFTPEKASSSPTRTLVPPVSAPAEGSLFAGRYRLIEELGEGGMGKVYRALDVKLKEEVALKFIRPEIASDPATLERFSNELKLARRISHRNIGRMYELMEDGGIHFITMEYVAGEDLKSLIHKTAPLSVGRSIAIAGEICAGLSEAQRQGVVHRDLKPSNILIDRHGSARIMDFGIARSAGVPGMTGAGVVVGTPEYMSPEQAEAVQVDERSDIYSLGVILFEMVTGRLPFTGETPLGVALKHKTEPAPDPRQFNALVPGDLSRLILRCLEKSREKRYQTAAEVLADLTKIERGTAASEPGKMEEKPRTSPDTSVKSSIRKLAWLPLVALGLVGLALGIWRAFFRAKTAAAGGDKPSIAILYFENGSGDKGLDGWKSGLTELIITDLEQSRYIRVLSGDRVYGILKKLDLLEAPRYSSDDLVKVADEGRVDHVASGTLMRAGRNLIITLRVQNPRTGEVIRSEKVECRGEEEIGSKVDELTKLIKPDLKLSPEQLAKDIDRDLGKITSSSPEALKAFAEGWRFFRAGEFRQSIPHFERAVAADPQFASAYDNLAHAYGNLGYRSEYKRYLSKAFESSDRASDLERYRIQGNYYLGSERKFGKAIEAYQKLLSVYPDFWIAHHQLGWLYGQSEEWDKAVREYDIIIRSRVSEFIPYANQSAYLAAYGRYARAAEILRYYLQNYPDNFLIHRNLAFGATIEGRFDEALAEAERVHALAPGFPGYHGLRGNVFLLQGNFAGADKEFSSLLETPEKIDHLTGRHRLAGLYVLQGKYEKAREQGALGIEEARAMGDMTWYSLLNLGQAYRLVKSGRPEQAVEVCVRAYESSAGESQDLTLQRLSLCYKGMALAEMGSLDEAIKASGELESHLREGINKKQTRYLDLLLGLIEIKRADYRGSIKHLKRALSRLPWQYMSSPADDNQALFYEPLALAYFQSGDLEKARTQYEKITSLTSGRLAFGDIYAKSFFMLGKIRERQGQAAEARRSYQKFLELWRDADPGSAEVNEARKSLADLDQRK